VEGVGGGGGGGGGGVGEMGGGNAVEVEAARRVTRTRKSGTAFLANAFALLPNAFNAVAIEANDSQCEA